MKQQSIPTNYRLSFFAIFAILFHLALVCKAQDEHNDLVGYKMRNRTARILVDENDSPNSKKIRILKDNYYFKKFDNQATVGTTKYRKIYFPGTQIEIKTLKEEKHEEIEMKEFVSTDLGRFYWMEEADLDDKVIQSVYKTYQATVFGSVLTAPFKGRLKIANAKGDFIDGSFNAGATIGYRFTRDGKSISYFAPIVFGQVTTLNFTSANNTSIKDLNTTQGGGGYSYGFGILFKFAGITPGIVLGFDHAFGDNGATFVYQDKPWLSFSLNFDFGKKKETENK